MCSSAASRSGTTAAEMSRERYSRPKSSSVAGDHAVVRRNAASPWTVTPASCRAATTRGRNSSATVGVHEQRLGGVADAGAVGLGVEHDRQRHVEVGRGVDVDVAVADPGLDHRHRRLLDHRLDQARSPARDEHVDQPAGAHQLLDGLARLGRHQLDDVGGQPGVVDRVAQHADERGVAVAGAAAAPEQHGVARLEADAGRVDGDVGAALVDHPDHAERHPDLPQLQPVGERAAPDDLADRVGQPGQVAQARRPSLRPGRRSGAAGRPCGPACRRPPHGVRRRRWPPAPRRYAGPGRRPSRAARRP